MPVLPVLFLLKPTIVLLIKKGVIVLAFKTIFSSSPLGKGKALTVIGGYLFSILLSLGVLYGVYVLIGQHYAQAKEIKQYKERIDELNTELDKAKLSNKASQETVRKLNQKLKAQYANREKDKKALDSKIEEINQSEGSDIVKTNQKLDAYYGDIYSLYCQLDKQHCAGVKK